MDVVEPQPRAAKRGRRTQDGASASPPTAVRDGNGYGNGTTVMAGDACCARGLPLLILGAVDCVGGGREGRGSVGLALVGGDEKLAIVASLMSPYIFFRLHHRPSDHSLMLSPRLFISLSGLSLSRMLNVFFASFPSPLTHFQTYCLT